MTNSEIPPKMESDQEPDWVEHFTQWRQSGLTQREYCRQAGLSRHRFKYWRRKLEPEQFGSRNPRASGFVPVQVERPRVEASLSLSLPNGLILRGIDAGNVDLVKRLVERL